MSVFLLAHFSDPHLGPLPTMRWWQFLSKRFIGYSNWHIRRMLRHNMESLTCVMDDMRAKNPDHIACTGDLCVIGLKQEFIAGRAFLEGLGEPENLSLVPGNHDTYVSGTSKHPLRHWRDYMSSDVTWDMEHAYDRNPHFPFVRLRGKVAIIGVSTGVPTAPFLATGKVGRKQNARLAAILKKLGEEGYFRVVMIHHPPKHGEHRLRRLTDTKRVLHTLTEHGAELVLHGHNHRSEQVLIHRPHASSIPIIGVTSASAPPYDKKEAGGYNLYAIEQTPQGWRCEAKTYTLQADSTLKKVWSQEYFYRMEPAIHS
jgi:3',5'-cyclic AMP phosphodiesterase CpdA